MKHLIGLPFSCPTLGDILLLGKLITLDVTIEPYQNLRLFLL